MTEELRVVKGAAARLRDGNPEPRVPCVLLLDVSGSMSGDKIHELNAGLETIRTELLKDEQAARRVELAVVAFGGKVEVVQDFALPAEFRPPTLSADGDTPMGAAILRGIDLVQKRRARYEASDLDSYEPWIFLVTDGVSTDPAEVMAGAVQAVRANESQPRGKRIAFFAVGVEGADMQKLAQVSKRPPMKLRGLSFARMFRWVSQSLTRTSRTEIGDRVPLANPIADGWAEA
jgi:uncharacterized protein YegL